MARVMVTAGVHASGHVQVELADVLDVGLHHVKIRDRERRYRVRVHHGPVPDGLREKEFRSKVPMAAADLEDAPAWRVLGHEPGELIVVIFPYSTDDRIVLVRSCRP